jgi:elongation factor Tu
MEKEIYSLGVIGHVDHGKTSFTSATTIALERFGKEHGASAKAYDQIDKAPEEKARGITIKQTTLEVYTSKRHYVLVDCPGHADYIKNMIAGAFQVDSVILLVAANASVQEQTKEHLLLASQIGIKSINLFINKMDLLDNESEEDRESAQKALQSTSPADKERELENIRSFFDELDEKLPSPLRDTSKPFQMFVDNVYSIAGRGTVVSGSAKQGILDVGQEVQIVKMGRTGKEHIKKTIASDLEEFNRKTKRISAGANFGCLLRGIDKSEVETGDMLTAVMPIHFYTKFNVKMVILSAAEGGRSSPIHANYQPSFFIGTAPHTGSILELKDKDGNKMESAQPGEMDINAIISFANPIYLETNSTMIFREGGKTVGYATVMSGIADPK